MGSILFVFTVASWFIILRIWNLISDRRDGKAFFWVIGGGWGSTGMAGIGKLQDGCSTKLE